MCGQIISWKKYLAIRSGKHNTTHDWVSIKTIIRFSCRKRSDIEDMLNAKSTNLWLAIKLEGRRREKKSSHILVGERKFGTKKNNITVVARFWTKNIISTIISEHIIRIVQRGVTKNKFTVSIEHISTTIIVLVKHKINKILEIAFHEHWELKYIRGEIDLT